MPSILISYLFYTQYQQCICLSLISLSIFFEGCRKWDWVENCPCLISGRTTLTFLFATSSKAFLTFRNLQTITRPQYQCSCKPLSFRKCKSFSLNNCFTLVHQSSNRKWRCKSLLLSDNTSL